MWTSRVPDWLLDYPCVATSDWVAYGDFPDGINPGVLLAKRHAPWLRYNLAAHRYYIEENFVWNAVLMSYRTYERHPDQLFYYRHLQVRYRQYVYYFFFFHGALRSQKPSGLLGTPSSCLTERTKGTLISSSTTGIYR